MSPSPCCTTSSPARLPRFHTLATSPPPASCDTSTRLTSSVGRRSSPCSVGGIYACTAPTRARCTANACAASSTRRYSPGASPDTRPVISIASRSRVYTSNTAPVLAGKVASNRWNSSPSVPDNAASSSGARSLGMCHHLAPDASELGGKVVHHLAGGVVTHLAHEASQ